MNISLCMVVMLQIMANMSLKIHLVYSIVQCVPRECMSMYIDCYVCCNDVMYD